jgi:ribosomal protein L16/L10AE
MSEKIVQLNEEVIKGQIKELVRGNVEETLNELLEKEAEQLTQAARIFNRVFQLAARLWIRVFHSRPIGVSTGSVCACRISCRCFGEYPSYLRSKANSLLQYS